MIQAMQDSEARRDDSTAQLLSRQQGGRGRHLGKSCSPGSKGALRTMLRWGGRRRRRTLEGYPGRTRWYNYNQDGQWSCHDLWSLTKYVYQVREGGVVRKNSIVTTTGRVHQTDSEPETKEGQLEIIYEIWYMIQSKQHTLPFCSKIPA